MKINEGGVVRDDVKATCGKIMANETCGKNIEEAAVKRIVKRANIG